MTATGAQVVTGGGTTDRKMRRTLRSGGFRITEPSLSSRLKLVRVELRGQVIAMSGEQAERLRDVAAAVAGVSAWARDLSLVLDWALATPRTVVLRRGEANEFVRLVRTHRNLQDVSALLSQAA